MGNFVLKEKYKCWDDCKMSGCPTHEAKLQYWSLAGLYAFETGNTRVVLEENQIKALIKMFKQIKEKK